MLQHLCTVLLVLCQVMSPQTCLRQSTTWAVMAKGLPGEVALPWTIFSLGTVDAFVGAVL